MYLSTTSTKQGTSRNTYPKIFVLHENDEWVKSLFDEMQKRDLPFVDWFVHHGQFDLNAIPPNGIFYNRLSASSHTREHFASIGFAESIVAWLEANGRMVVNDRRALQLEVRKTEQMIALNRAGIATPRTMVAAGVSQIASAARELDCWPVIVKPNCGGKGTGVRKFSSQESLCASLLDETDSFQSIDGIFLVQEYVEPQDGRIIRMEFIGGKFYYAVSVDASGGFELCPADACNIGDAFCPAGEGDHQFEILPAIDNSLIPAAEEFLLANGFTIAAIEFVLLKNGQPVVYDINMNTNYNGSAEQRDPQGRNGMGRIAEFLGTELRQLLTDTIAKSA